LIRNEGMIEEGKMQTIFTVQNRDLERLNPQQAVVFFRELLWAEAIKTGIAVNKINVSFRINVTDGGIDASIREIGTSCKSDLIKPGLTCYQIKASTSFKPWQETQVKKELFGKKQQPVKENLGNSVKGCLDNDGTYVLVCFKQDLTEKENQKAVRFFKSCFYKCGYKNPKVEIWGQNNIISFLYRFPSLALRLNERGGMKFQERITNSV
jgi:hypothetical protein